MTMTRRWLLGLLAVGGLPVRALARPPVSGADTPDLPASFPAQDPALARDMVGAAHANVDRVRELLEDRPALAKASWDWGFGDWETALGAASHTGNREIATLLLERGAAPTLFSATMLGELETVRSLIAARPGIQRTRGPHGITLLAHARAGGEEAAGVAAFLLELGDADVRYPNEPLSDADRRRLVGSYAFGVAVTDRLVVSDEPRGLTIARDGGSKRTLFHFGSRVFHPAGAPAVRVRFTGEESPRGLSIEDGSLTVRARRAG
jgi:hypothetical protein